MAESMCMSIFLLNIRQVPRSFEAYFLRWPSTHVSLALGIGAGVTAAIGFGFANALVHRTSVGFPVAEITFVRALVGAGIALPIVYTRLGSLVRARAASIWVVAAAGAVSILCLAYSIQCLPKLGAGSA
jgi:drug/metabolite transporter (DMT)-like permease